jgi:uncharacterized membrane protein (UPF0127 family)
MKQVRVVNQNQVTTVCARCSVADNPVTRIRGLLGKKTLSADEGLLIVPCSSVHMFGMKFSLDVLFLTRENIVTDFVENLPPGKLYVARRNFGKAHAALEVAPGTIAATATVRGDQIQMESLG